MTSRQRYLALGAGALALVALVVVRRGPSREPRAGAPTGDAATSALPAASRVEVDVGTLKAPFSRGDAEQRRRAIEQASASGTPEAVSWLAELAGSGEETASAAGAALGRVTNPRAAGAALGRVTNPRAAARLGEILRSDASTLARANAARALGAAGTQRDLEALGATLSDGSAPLRVRQEAALAAARVGGPASVSHLSRALEEARSPTDEQLRIALIQSLGSVKSDAARASLERHRAREVSANERAFLDKALGP